MIGVSGDYTAPVFVRRGNDVTLHGEGDRERYDVDDFGERGRPRPMPAKDTNRTFATETHFRRRTDGTLTLVRHGDVVPPALADAPTVPARLHRGAWVPVRPRRVPRTPRRKPTDRIETKR